MHIDSPGPLQCLIAGCTAGESLVICHSSLRGPRRILSSSHFSPNSCKTSQSGTVLGLGDPSRGELLFIVIFESIILVIRDSDGD